MFASNNGDECAVNLEMKMLYRTPVRERRWAGLRAIFFFVLLGHRQNQERHWLPSQSCRGFLALRGLDGCRRELTEIGRGQPKSPNSCRRPRLRPALLLPPRSAV